MSPEQESVTDTERIPSIGERSIKFRPIPFVITSLLVIFILYQIIGGGITYLLLGKTITSDTVTLVRIATMIAQLLFLLLPTLLLFRWQHGSFRVLPHRVPKAIEFVLALLALIALLQFLEGYTYFQDKIPLPPSVKPIVDEMKRMIEETYRVLTEAHSIPELISVICVVAVTPALCEELLFRGLVQYDLSLAAGSRRGFVLTGIIFGLYHFNPFLVVPLVILGIFFGFLLYRSQTILLPILAHFVNNFVSTLGIYFQGREETSGLIGLVGETDTVPASAVLSTMAVFGIVFAISVYYYVKVTTSVRTSNEKS